jgi:hypothetical protein
MDLTDGPGAYSFDVVGEIHYQEILESICGGRTKKGHRLEVEAYLVPENDGPYGRNAVRVYIQGLTVGYLHWKSAPIFREQMKETGVAGAAAKCNAIIVGGWDHATGDRGYFGVRVDLPWAKSR